MLYSTNKTLRLLRRKRLEEVDGDVRKRRKIVVAWRGGECVCNNGVQGDPTIFLYKFFSLVEKPLNSILPLQQLPRTWNTHLSSRYPTNSIHLHPSIHLFIAQEMVECMPVLSPKPPYLPFRFCSESSGVFLSSHIRM